MLICCNSRSRICKSISAAFALAWAIVIVADALGVIWWVAAAATTGLGADTATDAGGGTDAAAAAESVDTAVAFVDAGCDAGCDERGV